MPDLLASSYSDAVWTVALAEETDLRLSGQFMIEGGIGDERVTGPDFQTWVGGIKGHVIYNGLILTAGYTFNGKDDNWQAPHGSWPGYTSMIVKDFNRAGEQLVDVAQIAKPGTILVTLEPLFENGLEGMTPGSNCIVNAYTSNHERLANEELGTFQRFGFHAVDAIALVHAMILRVQALFIPIRTLVLTGH